MKSTLSKFRSIFAGMMVALMMTACNQTLPPAEMVDPFIGTGGHGHTFPGPAVPFGMVQLSPDTRLDGWDGCSGYHYSDSVIYGFSHTHLSGTGCSDYGDILLMPVNKTVDLTQYGYASGFRKSSEYARAGYYRVTLDAWNARAELTATARTGFHRYTYHGKDTASVVIDLKHRDEVLESALTMVSDTEVSGYRISRAWAAKQMVYFVARFSRPIERFRVLADGLTATAKGDFQGKSIHAQLFFGNNDDPLLVKVGISAISEEGARKNLDSENPGWDFDAVKDTATMLWNRELSKIAVKGGSPEERTIFYTAFYHLMIQPNLYTDVDRRYRGRDLQVHHADGFDYYTVFSLWDTYRAAHPLLTITDQQRTVDFIRTFIRQYEEGGMLPVWELSANETGCMIGYHAIPVIADAWLKGIRGFDTLKAFEAMKHSAMQDHLGLRWYREKGYIPGDKEGESVSKTLEYAYDDWCIAQVARVLGREEDYRYFSKRAQHYRNLFDPATGFMRAKLNETWFVPFDPSEVNFHYTEANAWQYSFYVPQDLGGLMELQGGAEKFAARLDSLFSADSQTTGRHQADITGLIGQYAHGNEPSHHMAYLYDYAGKPWKTQELVHRICRELYAPTPDGLSGNEDCGQMSAWYLFSAMGFYPVTPGSGFYAIGTPLFPETTLHLENGKNFTIKANGLSEERFYIQSALLNGLPLEQPFLPHAEIMKGGLLILEMGGKRSDWGCRRFEEDSQTELVEPVPFVEQGDATFFDSTLLVLNTIGESSKIYYTLSSGPTAHPGNFKPFTTPLVIRESMILLAYAQRDGEEPSEMIEAVFQKIPKNRKIKVNAPYASQYSAGGDVALIDFRRGSSNFRTGSWQGYEGVDLSVVIDLGKPEPIHQISAGFIQDQGSWIFMPEWVEFLVSDDGNEYASAGKVLNDVPERESEPVIKDFTLKLSGKKARFIKVIAKNRSVCPGWHPGAGHKAWIFADEILLNGEGKQTSGRK